MSPEAWHCSGLEVLRPMGDSVDGGMKEPAVQGMLAELKQAGIAIDDFGVFTSLRPTTLDFAAAAPILLSWLPRIESETIKDVIARSLTGEPEARRLGAARVLVDEFPRLADQQTKWAYGNALSTLADESVADDLIALLRDREHGTGRQMLCDALKRTRDPRAPDVLIELIDDDDVAGHAILALRLYGRKASVPHLHRAEQQLNRVIERATSTPFARSQARKALSHLGQ